MPRWTAQDVELVSWSSPSLWAKTLIDQYWIFSFTVTYCNYVALLWGGLHKLNYQFAHWNRSSAALVTDLRHLASREKDTGQPNQTVFWRWWFLRSLSYTVLKTKDMIMLLHNLPRLSRDYLEICSLINKRQQACSSMMVFIHDSRINFCNGQLNISFHDYSA